MQLSGNLASRAISSFVCFGLMLGASNIATAQYTFKTLDVPGATFTFLASLNSQVSVGSYGDASFNAHGFLYSGGVFQYWDVPGSLQTDLTFVNHLGLITGDYDDGTRFYGFIRDKKGNTITLDPPGSIVSKAFCVNERGDVVGRCNFPDQDQKRHGFLWSKGTYTIFNFPNDNPDLGTAPYGINDAGQIVGIYMDMAEVVHGFFLNKGAYKQLDYPGSTFTIANRINNSGVIVGYYGDTDGFEHGFILNHGVYTTVDIPGAAYTEINTITDDGVIGGFYEDALGDHSFIGTPVH